MLCLHYTAFSQSDMVSLESTGHLQHLVQVQCLYNSQDTLGFHDSFQEMAQTFREGRNILRTTQPINTRLVPACYW